MANRPIQGQKLSPFQELYAQGIRVLHVDATFSEDIFHPELRAWSASDTFDYTYQERYWERLLTACPEARFCLRLYAGSPPWWDTLHPEELQRYADGSAEATFQRSSRRTLPSLASLVWRNSACDALARFLQWLEASQWAEKIWGLFIGYGITWEWGILGSDKLPDYSEPMRRRFREWLKEEYKGVGALRAQWGDSNVDFDTADIPSLEARFAGNQERRVFPRDRASADFQNCLSDTNVDYLLELGRTVRSTSGQRYKLGTFYGYTLTAREHNSFTASYGAGGLSGGHHSFWRFLRSGIFDFNASPYAYADRELGHGCLIQHFPRASCQWHGLRVYEENDLRTFLVAGLPDDRTISIGQTCNLEDSLRHQRWALAQALCHGTSYWWTELSDWIGPYKPWFDHPEILAEIKRHFELFGRFEKASQPEPAEIAVIIDERSIAALSLDSQLFKREVYEQLAAWSWCGAPFDIWLADDVTPETMKSVRLAYIFCPMPSSDLLQRFNEVLCRDARTVWWGPVFTLPRQESRRRESVNDECSLDSSGIHKSEFGTWTSLSGPCAGFSAIALAEVARAAGVRLFGEAPLHVMKGKCFLALQADEDREVRLGSGWMDLWSGMPIGQGAIILKKHDTALLYRDDEGAHGNGSQP